MHLSDQNKSYDKLEANPDYGKGIYRRRIRVENQPGRVLAEMEDVTHAFRLILEHDDCSVTAIEAKSIRYPFDTCPAAIAVLEPLVGCALGTDSLSFRNILQPGQNCTHLYDLALLALAHSIRPVRLRVYDISVPDECEDGATIRLERDGVVVYEWRVKAHQVLEPAALAGKPMRQGFYNWASEQFDGDSLESALVLSRGYFVSQSRRHDYMHQDGRPAAQDDMPEGSCYTYNTGVVERAIHTGGMARDFTATAEQLLKFL